MNHAERMNACFRACEGISDEVLSDTEYCIKNELDNLDEQISKRLKVEKQRDELLELIKRHLCDNPESKSLYCQCDLCKETRDVINKIEANK